MEVAETTKSKKTKPEPKPSAELTLPQRAAVALDTSAHEKALRALVETSASIKEVKNKDGREECHAAYMLLKNTRVAIGHKATAATEDAKAFTKAVNEEKDRLIGIASKEETRLQTLRDTWDAAIEAEKAAKIAAERNRIAGIQADIQGIRDVIIGVVGKDSAQIQVARMAVDSINGADESRFDEFTAEASKVIAETSAKLAAMFDAAVEAEEKAIKDAADRDAEAKHIADERAELDRRKKEQDEAAEVERKKLADERAKQDKERDEADAKAAALRKVEEDKLEEQRKELAAQLAALDAARLAQEEAARVEQEKRDKEAKEAADAEAKRVKDAADEAARQEQAAAQAKKEAEDEQHMAAVHADVAAALHANKYQEIDVNSLIDLIRTGKIKHLSINY